MSIRSLTGFLARSSHCHLLWRVGSVEHDPPATAGGDDMKLLCQFKPTQSLFVHDLFSQVADKGQLEKLPLIGPHQTQNPRDQQTGSKNYPNQSR